MSGCSSFKRVKARKDHKCECYRQRHEKDGDAADRDSIRCIIHKGDFYQIQSGIFEGEPYTYRTCLFHAAVVSAIYKEEAPWMRGEGVDFDCIEEYIDCSSSKDWRKWINLIRKEYRRLKLDCAKRKAEA